MTTSTVSTNAQQRIVATLFIAQSLFGGGMIATFTVTTIVAAQLSGWEGLAGIPATLVLAGRAFIGYPVGWIMDHHGRRPGFVLGYFLTALGALWSGLAIVQLSFVNFCIGATLMGMGRGISEQTRYAAAEVYPPRQRAKVMGLLVWAGTVGSIGGPLLVKPTSSVATHYGLDPSSGPFWAMIGIALLAMTLVFLFLRPDPLVIGRQIGVEQGEEQPASKARPLGDIFANPDLRLAVAALVIGQLVMTLIMVITPLHMNHNHHDLQAISWVLMGHTLGMFGLSPLTGWLIDRYGRPTLIMAGGLVLVVSSIMAPLASGVLYLAIALFLLGLGWNFTFLAGSSLMADAVASYERGRVQGFSESMVAVASGVGSLGTGAAFAYGGMVLVSAIGLACSLAFMAGAVWAVQGARLVTAEK